MLNKGQHIIKKVYCLIIMAVFFTIVFSFGYYQPEHTFPPIRIVLICFFGSLLYLLFVTTKLLFWIETIIICGITRVQRFAISIFNRCCTIIEKWLRNIQNLIRLKYRTLHLKFLKQVGTFFFVDKTKYTKQDVIRVRLKFMYLFIFPLIYLLYLVLDRLICYLKLITWHSVYNHMGYILIVLIVFVFCIGGMWALIVRYHKSVVHYEKTKLSYKNEYGEMTLIERWKMFEAKMTAPIFMNEDLAIIITSILFFIIIPCLLIAYVYCCSHEFTLTKLTSTTFTLISLSLAITSLIYTREAREENLRMMNAFAHREQNKSTLTRAKAKAPRGKEKKIILGSDISNDFNN